MNHIKTSMIKAATCILSAGATQTAAWAEPHHDSRPADAQLIETVDALKARIGALEQALADQRAMLDAQQQRSTIDTRATAQTAANARDEAVQAPVPVKVDLAASQPKPDRLYYKGLSITFGGFVEAASIYRSHSETADIASSFSKIPFANDRASHTDEFRFTPRQSRLSALVQGDIDSDKRAYAFVDVDFQGAAQTANSVAANGYNPRLRQLYVQLDWDKPGLSLLAGQAWSLLTTTAKGITARTETPPPTIDAQFVPGFVWTRQPQIRLTKRFGNSFWAAASLESPQTTFGSTATPTGVTLTNTQSPTSGFFNGNSYSLNKVPDVIGKVAWESHIGRRAVHLEAFGLLRSFYDRVSIAPTSANQAGQLQLAPGTLNLSTTGGGYGASLTAQLIPGLLDGYASVLRGRGIGRYGTAGLPDVATRPDGRLEGIPETLWLAGATLHATSKLDFYFYGGGESERSTTYSDDRLTGVSFGYGGATGASNAGCLIEGGTCNAATRSIRQRTAGFWQKIYQGAIGRVQVGAQYSWTERRTFADAGGVAPRAAEKTVLTSIRYYPF